MSCVRAPYHVNNVIVVYSTQLDGCPRERLLWAFARKLRWRNGKMQQLMFASLRGLQGLSPTCYVHRILEFDDKPCRSKHGFEAQIPAHPSYRLYRMLYRLVMVCSPYLLLVNIRSPCDPVSPVLLWMLRILLSIFSNGILCLQ